MKKFLFISGMLMSGSSAFAIDMEASVSAAIIPLSDGFALFSTPDGEASTEVGGLRSSSMTQLSSGLCPFVTPFRAQGSAVPDNCGVFTDNFGESGFWSYFDGGNTSGTTDYQNRIQIIYNRDEVAGAPLNFAEYWSGQFVGTATEGVSTTVASCPTDAASCPAGTLTFCGESLLYDSVQNVAVWTGESQLCIDDSVFIAPI